MFMICYSGYNITADSFRNDPILAYHRVIEAFKFSYGQRLNLGDADYNETIQQVSTRYSIIVNTLLSLGI